MDVVVRVITGWIPCYGDFASGRHDIDAHLVALSLMPMAVCRPKYAGMEEYCPADRGACAV
ncbi:MAG: hypothetical protein ACYDGU_02910 [Acidiferrobacterales bacterium]